MATVVYYGTPDPDFGVSYIEVTPTRITVALNGLVSTYTGAITVSAGAAVGGTITGYSLTQGSRQLVTVEGLNVPAADLYRLAASNDADGVARLMFGGSDQIWGSAVGEAIIAAGGADTVIALDGDDTVFGGDGADDVNGNVGRDVVAGDAGADWVRGGKDNDTILGGDGDDPHVNGNLGDDLVFGEAGHDSVFGGQGNDYVSGGAGDDSLSGDLGNDVLEGGGGADFLAGGSGADLFVWRPGDGVDGIGDFNSRQGDRIGLPTGTTYVVTTMGDYFGRGAVPKDWETFVVIDIDNSPDAIILYGVNGGGLQTWQVFI